MSAPALHESLRSVAFLLGTWSGEGRGEYPTIASFGYRETVTFGHVGKPFLAYSQRTQATDDGRPLHAESGFWRFPSTGVVELTLSYPHGHAETAGGIVTELPGGGTLHVQSLLMAATPTAKDVIAVERTLTVDGDVLRYELSMAAVGQPMTHHLSAELHRQA